MKATHGIKNTSINMSSYFFWR